MSTTYYHTENLEQSDSESFDGSSDVDSVFSDTASIHSTQASDFGAVDFQTLVREFAVLLWRDEVVRPSISTAISKEDIGLEVARHKFRQLLKRFAQDLKLEAQTKDHKAAVRFVGSSSPHVTREVFLKLPTDN